MGRSGKDDPYDRWHRSSGAEPGPARRHEQREVVPFRQAVRTWFAISLQTFGGPAGQIAVMQRALVEEKRWIGQRRFLHALSYCTRCPDPKPSSSRSTWAGS